MAGLAPREESLFGGKFSDGNWKRRRTKPTMQLCWKLQRSSGKSDCLVVINEIETHSMTGRN